MGRQLTLIITIILIGIGFIFLALDKNYESKSKKVNDFKKGMSFQEMADQAKKPKE